MGDFTAGTPHQRITAISIPFRLWRLSIALRSEPTVKHLPNRPPTCKTEHRPPPAKERPDAYRSLRTARPKSPQLEMPRIEMHLSEFAPMRIAQVMAGARTGGAELFFERLTIALAGAGDQVLPIIRRDAARAARLAAAGLQPRELGFGGPLDLLTGRRLGAALRRFAPRVAVAWMSRAAGFTPAGDWVLIGRLGGYYDLRHFHRCDHLVANTAELTRWILRQGFPPARVHQLPNFAPDLAGAKPVPRASLGVPEDVALVLALGRLHPNKAFDVLVRTLPRLPRVHVLIAGDGPERESLEALARSEGVADRLHLPGWRGDIDKLLAAADLLICPSARSRWATWCWRPGRHAARSSPPPRRGRPS